MSELGNNLTSDWIKATGVFGRTPQKPPVMFYVEGDEDVPFWKEAVRPYQGKYNIHVTTNKAVNPQKGNGKTVLLTMSGLGPNKIVAVDADFDLIIDGYSTYTSQVRTSPYVVNTTWYSIENVLMQKTKEVPLLESFSNVSGEWFIDYLTGVANGNLTSPIKQFGRILNELSIQRLALQGDFSSIAEHSPTEPLEKRALLKKNLEQMGYRESDFWKLMRGHNLWNTIVRPVEEMRMKKEIDEKAHTLAKTPDNHNREEAMNVLGIHKSVREHLEHDFYTKDLAQAPAPAGTRAKLDQMFP